MAARRRAAHLAAAVRRSCGTRSPASRCWFNQVAFLNEWTLEPEIREFLVDVYGADGLPFTTRFGHGDPIGEDVVALLNQSYAAHTRREPWQAGDLLLVDNIRTAHSREPYDGPREVLVAMTDPVHVSACAPHTGGTADERLERIIDTAPARSVDRRQRGVRWRRAAVRGDLRRAGPAGVAGQREADRRAGRGHLPAARRRATR